MLPSSSESEGPRSSNLRRWGPLAIIVVILLIIGGVVLATRSSNDNNKNSSATASAGPPLSTGAISFSQAKQQGRTDLTFPNCDTSTGNVAIPTNYPAPCFANQPAQTDPNTQGVTNDSINVDVYIPPDQDAILDYITAAIQNNDTGDQVEATYTGYNALYQAMYQTYGRKVNIKFLRASGQSSDAVAARADAVKAAETDHAFAVWGGPVLTRAWTDELNARGVVCLGCFAVDTPQPNVYSLGPSADQSSDQLTEYVTKRLANKPAQFAGDPAFQKENRVFGHLFITTTGGTEQQNADKLRDKLKANGVDFAQRIPYTLDPARLQEEATSVISQLKQAGVTSVIFQGDPVAPAAFTQEATRQNYFPEWIIGPGALTDTTAFGRTYDQKQWAHAFGISALTARIDPQVSDYLNLYKWFNNTTPPAIDTAPVLWPQPATFYAALQAAGPKLNADTFRAGLFSLAGATGRVTTQTLTFGKHGYWPQGSQPETCKTPPPCDDYNGIDDYTEIWWDTTATGPDEIRKNGTGMYQYSEGGKRFLPGQWTSDTHAFDKNGAVTIYFTPPPGEGAKNYPPPAAAKDGSGSSSSGSTSS
jgi:Periplasmic binding protein